jgi:hypothetical protein
MTGPVAKDRAGVVIVAHRDRRVAARLCDRMARSGRRAGMVGAPSELLAALAPALEDASAVAGIVLDDDFATESVRGALMEAVRSVQRPWRIFHLEERRTGRVSDWIDPKAPMTGLEGDVKLWHVLLGRFRLRHARLVATLNDGVAGKGPLCDAATVRRVAGAAARLGMAPLASSLRAVENALTTGDEPALRVAIERLWHVEARTSAAIDTLLGHDRRSSGARASAEASFPTPDPSSPKSNPDATRTEWSGVSSPT